MVVKATGSWYTVRDGSGREVACKVKGNFRLKGIRSTSPVAVGDRVVTSSDKDGEAFITGIADRRNYIVRKSPNLSKQSQVLAANVDLAVLVATVARPETSTTFIDRFIASAEAYRIPVALIFNKADSLSAEEGGTAAALAALYGGMGYECLHVSALTGLGMDAVGELLRGKVSLLSGHSGVGKSTLVNRLLPGASRRTADISEAHGTGVHTTTYSEMLPLPQGGYVIDSPGIKGFGTFDIGPGELCGYFRDIFAVSKGCRFSNCTHTHEPGCAVREALEKGGLAPSRYVSYLSMMEDRDGDRYRPAY